MDFDEFWDFPPKNISRFKFFVEKNKIFLLKNKFNFNYINNYTLLIILSGFAIFPYLLLNKSSTILYLGAFTQRHAFLLAPIYGIFFSMMFRDLSKINCLQKKVNTKKTEKKCRVNTRKCSQKNPTTKIKSILDFFQNNKTQVNTRNFCTKKNQKNK